jgi:hypothetical protein
MPWVGFESKIPVFEPAKTNSIHFCEILNICLIKGAIIYDVTKYSLAELDHFWDVTPAPYTVTAGPQILPVFNESLAEELINYLQIILAVLLIYDIHTQYGITFRASLNFE